MSDRHLEDRDRPGRPSSGEGAAVKEDAVEILDRVEARRLEREKKNAKK